MAIEPKKDTETEAALKAIEEALSQASMDLDDVKQPAADEAVFDPDFSELELSLAEAANDRKTGTDASDNVVFSEDFPILTDALERTATELPSPTANAQPARSRPRGRRTEDVAASVQHPTPAAANENHRDDISDLVEVLQQQSRGSAWSTAAMLSAGWLSLCGVLLYLGASDGTLKFSELGRWQIAGLAAIAIIPVMLFSAFAVMVRKAHEMRLAASTMTEAAIRLLQPETVAGDSIATVGRAVRREVASIGDGIERALGRASELEMLVQSEVRNIERSYSDSEVRLRGLVDELSTERVEIINHAEKLRESLSFTHTGLTEELDQVTGRIQNSIDEGTIRMSEALRARHDTIHATLEEAGANLVTLLSNSGGDLQDAVAIATQQAKDSLSGKAHELGKQVNMIGQAVASLLETRTAAIRESGENVTREIEMALGARALEFSGRLNLIDSNISGHSNALLEKLTGHADRLEGQLGRIEESVSTRGEAMVEALGMRTTALDKVLSERSAVMGDIIGQQLAGFGQALTGQVDAVVSNLAERHDALDTLGARINEALDSRAGRIEETMRTRTGELANVFANGDQALRSTIELGLTGSSEAARHITSLVEERNMRLIGDIDQRAQLINDTLVSRTNDISAAFQIGDANIRDAIDNGLTGSARAAERITSLIDERNTALVNQIEARTQAIGGTLDQKTAVLLSGMDERATIVTSVLDDRTGRIMRGVDERTVDFVKNLDQRAQMLAMSVEEKNRALAAVLSNQTQTIGEVIDDKAERLSRILSERATAINTSLGSSLLDTQRTIEERSSELSKVLSERMRELNDVLESQAKPIVEAISQRGTDVTVRLGALHQTVANDLNQLLAALAGSSDIMQRLLDTAGSRLSSMQETITTQARELVQAVDKANRDVNISAQVATGAQQKMDSTASGLVSTIANVAERFEEQGLMLQHATRLIDAAQGNFSATLEEKQESLHALASGLVERTQTIERTMASFGEMLRKSLDEVSEKSRGVGSIVSTEIGSAIEQANMRFAKSVEVMRQAAADVQRDLEETREQMRRGVLELPDETRESAEAMRQVVADQIAALRDLSGIVARSGKAIELPPSQRLAATGGSNFGRGTTRTAEPAQAAIPPQPSPSRRPEVTDSGRPFARSAAAVEAPAPAQPVRRTEPAARTAVSQPAREPAAGQQGGWVSDLLRRASRDEEDYAPAPQSRREEPAARRSAPAPAARSPLHAVESLNSISMDIARAIDHNAFIDLWDRYQRGERNIFTRRLYTLQGEQTFDEIRTKYGRDPEFRSAVDRYIRDFERLISDASQGDRDNMVTQTYLTSETGKVYTMLAHAAGRLGG